MKAYGTATGSGNNVSVGVWLPNGTSLKGIMLIFSSVVNKNFYSISRLTFLGTSCMYNRFARL
jgi:hypothetical protein